MDSYKILGWESYFDFENKVKMLLGKESFINAVKKVNEEIKKTPSESTKMHLYYQISSDEEIKNPSKFHLNILAGEKGKKYINDIGLPSIIKSSPMTFSLGFSTRTIKDSFIFANLLKKIKQKFINNSIKLDFFSKYYISCIFIEKTNINIRSMENKVYMDFSVSGLEADIMSNIISNFDLSLLDYTIDIDFNLLTQFNAMEIFNKEKSFHDILSDLFKFKFEAKGDAYKLLSLSKVFIEFFKSFQNIGIISSDKNFIILIQILRIIKLFGFRIDYSSNEILNALFEIDSIFFGGQIKNFSDCFKKTYQEELKALLDWIPSIIEDFIKDDLLEDDFSIDCIKSSAINYENLEFSLMHPDPNLIIKLNVNFKGLNELIDDILNIDFNKKP
jgi:hypothetical protein